PRSGRARAGHPRAPRPAESPALDLAVGPAALRGCAGVELDHEPVAPAVLGLRARLNVADELGRGRRAKHPRAAAEFPAAHAPPHARLLQYVLHPVRAPAALRHEVKAAPAPREPDLDLSRLARLAAPGREIEIRRFARRRRVRHVRPRGRRTESA